MSTYSPRDLEDYKFRNKMFLGIILITIGIFLIACGVCIIQTLN